MGGTGELYERMDDCSLCSVDIGQISVVRELRQALLKATNEQAEMAREMEKLEQRAAKLVGVNQALADDGTKLRFELVQLKSEIESMRSSKHRHGTVIINIQRCGEDPEPAEVEPMRVMCPLSRRGCYGPRCKFYADWHSAGCLLAVEGYDAAKHEIQGERKRHAGND